MWPNVKQTYARLCFCFNIYESASSTVCVVCVVDHFWVIVPDMLLVMVAEIIVDSVKHAFITKFNELPSEVELLYCLRYHTLNVHLVFVDECVNMHL
jgi:Eukaryotic membrane protein family